MGATDVLKKSFLDNFQLAGELDIVDVVITLALAFVIGLFIYFIYRLTFSGVIFAKSFGTSLIMLTMITSMIILPISTNVLLALGMVGALSIVRFRTAVKDPLDTIFMFWGIAAGIALGALQYAIAGLGSLIVGLMLIIWNLFKSKKHFPFILVIRFDDSCKKEVQAVLRKMPQGKLKSKVVSQGMMELTIEMNIDESEVGMIDAFSAIPGVHDASLISYKGDVVS
ncbi:MAG: DUF4956 domain-containing protein [Eubacteriales bacterium]|nr:DUF4956 domain-containing protein [Eubacteriales bacterium]